MTWREQAACRGADPSIFFPERGERLDAAKAFCDRCEVSEECLAFRLATPVPFGDPGVWGGTSERQRRRMRARPWAHVERQAS